MILPGAEAEHQHAVIRGRDVAARERAAEERTHPDHAEEVGADDRHGGVERIAARRKAPAAGVDVGGQVLERAGLAAPVMPVAGRDPITGLAIDAVVLPHRHQPRGVGIRQRTQQHGVDGAEDGGRRADGDREGHEHERRVGRPPREHAKRVARVVPPGVETPGLAGQEAARRRRPRTHGASSGRWPVPRPTRRETRAATPPARGARARRSMRAAAYALRGAGRRPRLAKRFMATARPAVPVLVIS